MNYEESINVLEQALNNANKAGAFNLADANITFLALNNIKDLYLSTLVVNKTELKSEPTQDK